MDLDTAARALGTHIESEVEKQRRAEEKALNPKRTGGGKKSKGSTREYVALTEERRREIWVELVAKIIDDKLVFHIAPGKGKTGRRRVEKRATGDKAIDANPNKGARTVYDAEGRRRAEFDASGKRTFHWDPEE